MKAEIKKHVTPYIIKPSAITLDFNKNVNPKVIKRKARHKRIETTLRYDHTSDETVRRHFEMQSINTKNLTDLDKKRLLFDRYISGELDIETFKQGIGALSEQENKKDYQGIGYV